MPGKEGMVANGNEGFSMKRTAGAITEYGGAGYGILEALTLNGGGALIGAAIWIIGRWVRYSGENK